MEFTLCLWIRGVLKIFPKQTDISLTQNSLQTNFFVFICKNNRILIVTNVCISILSNIFPFNDAINLVNLIMTHYQIISFIQQCIFAGQKCISIQQHLSIYAVTKIKQYNTIIKTIIKINTIIKKNIIIKNKILRFAGYIENTQNGECDGNVSRVGHLFLLF